MNFPEDYIKEQLKDPEFKEAWKETEEPYQIVAQIIQLRKDLGLTQKQLADLTEMKQSAIARVENGDGGIRLDTLIRITSKLGAKVKIVPDKRETVKE